MCDSFIALAAATADGATLFAKNSDRERNEAQALEMTPRGDHPPGAVLELTYIDIAQVPRTHACLLSRPFWTWGAEMGANEHGVVIGNEAVHAIRPAQRKRALIGMDLVRLGLERAASADEAVDVIVGLLEQHGQGGDCGHLARFYYHNSFLIADRRQAYVLETVDRGWALERVPLQRALSNALSIGRDYHSVSGLSLADARAQGWLDEDQRFDFAARLIDRERDRVSQGVMRGVRGMDLLRARSGSLAAADMMRLLRDHGAAEEGAGAWTPATAVGKTICMHAAQGARRSQTTGSMVSGLGPGSDVHWLTASAAPCLGIFKPVLFATGLPPQGPPPTDRYDPAARWWRHERIHRSALAHYGAARASFGPRRDALERGFVERIDQALGRDVGEVALRAVVNACWREADAAEEAWLVAHRPPSRAYGPYERSWTRLNHLADLPLS